MPILRIASCLLLLLSATAVTAEGAAGKSLAGNVLGVRDAAHLMQRTGLGADPVVVQRLALLSRSAAIDEIISGFSQQPSLPMPAWVNESAPPYWARGDMPRVDRRAFNRARNREVSELRRWWIAELISTPSPQTERLVLLWHNHFVSAYSGIDQESTSIARQNQMFRQRGSGHFRDLLSAVIRDPAMLNYLDNRSNKKKSPNENLARELLELFTMGEGEFDEFTVKEAARALTGWTVAVPANMSFTVEPWNQDQGEKTLFGESGMFDGDDLIDRILEQPATARYIAHLFWRNFVSEFSVDESAIESLAAIFTANNFDLKALYRALLESPAFWAEEYRGHIVKSPVDLLIGTIRTTGVVPRRWQALPAELGRLGQALFDPPNVAGWKGGRAWITPDRLLSRRAALQKHFRPGRLNTRADSRNASNQNRSITERSIAETSADNSMSDNSMSDNTMRMASGNRMSAETMVSSGHAMESAMESMSGAMASSMMAPDDLLSIRLASEDYKGSPRVQLVLRQGDSIVWASGEFTLEAGHDTERFGRLQEDDIVPWQAVDFRLPASVGKFSEISVEFLNDAAGNGGDRNLYVESVTVRGITYLARTGIQKSRCPPDDADAAGMLYCAGVLTIPALDGPQVTSPGHQQFIIGQAYTLWFQRPKKGADWRQLEIGLTDVQFDQRHWDTLVLTLVSSRDLGPGIQIASDGCIDDCFTLWPECAWTSEANVDYRSVFFPVERAQADADVLCHWDSLSDDDRRLVSSLLMVLPDVLAVVADGRKAQARTDAFQLWSAAVNKLHKKLDPDYRVDGAASELMVTGLDAANETQPQVFGHPLANGRTRDATVAALNELIQSDSNDLSAILAVAPVTELSRDASVSDLIDDPAFQVR